MAKPVNAAPLMKLPLGPDRLPGRRERTTQCSLRDDDIQDALPALRRNCSVAGAWRWHEEAHHLPAKPAAVSAAVDAHPIVGQSAVRLASHEGLKLPPGPAKHVEIDRTVDPDTCAGVVKLPDHPLSHSERGRPKQAPQPEPLAC
jgi:hypothetical protein